MSIQYNPGIPLLSRFSIYTLGLLAAIFGTSANAGIQVNTVDPAAQVSEKGRRVRITGPIACTVGQRAEVYVTLTQRATGAVAMGKSHFICTGYIQQWEVHAATQGREDFEAGAAFAVALGITSTRGKADDAHQWLVQITLVH